MLLSLKPSNPMAFWRSKEFLTLLQIWEEKLRESGFEDAEEGTLDARSLKQRAGNVYRSAPAVIRDAKQAYFAMLTEHAERHAFRTVVDRTIILSRCQGLKICEIAMALEQRGIGRHPKTIRSVIRFYENLWGIRTWLPNQIRPQPKKK